MNTPVVHARVIRLRIVLAFAPLLLLACAADQDQADESALNAGAGGATADDLGSGGEPAAGGTLSAGGTSQESGGASASGGMIHEGIGGEGTGGDLDASGGASAGGTESSGGADGAGGAQTGGDSGSGGAAGDECPFSGSIEYSFNGAESWPEDVQTLLTAAMAEAVDYYNCYGDFTHQLTVNYDPGVTTAQANVDGWMSFGQDRGYMVVATVMHEIAHTMGVGFFPWDELISEQIWVGPHVVAFMESLPSDQKDPDSTAQRDFITADSTHFWPYGLNYASEHVSEWSLINNVRIVSAMQADKQAYLDGEL